MSVNRFNPNHKVNVKGKARHTTPFRVERPQGQVIRATFSSNLSNMAQHCCISSKFNELLIVLPPRAQLATQQISSCLNKLRKVDPILFFATKFFNENEVMVNVKPGD